MTDRRPGPPLFELLNQDEPDPKDGHSSNPSDPSSKPDSQQSTTPKPTPAPTTSKPAQPASTNAQSKSQSDDRPSTPPISAGVSRAERSAATMPEDPPPSEGGFHLSTSRLYLSIAIVAVALVLVWAGAYKAGVEDGKGQMDPFITNKPLILPPNDSPTETTDNPQTRTTNNDPIPTDRVSEPPNSPARAAQAVMTAQGYKDQDPRISGHNYLQLATFSAEQAADAILFMNDNGIPIIGVPVVDSRVRAGNNPSRYTLYSVGLAVPGGGQFRAMQSQRNEHVRVIANLGARWQKERQGGSDFAESKTQWVKYN